MRSASTTKRPSARNRSIVSATAAPSRPSSSNSRRSKLLDTWMSMLGLSVGSTPAISMIDDSRKRVRMSLALLATTNCATGSTHALGAVAGEHVAEVAGRHRERDRRAPAGEARRRGDVVDDLGHDPGPVDRVDRRQVDPVTERLVGEQRLDQVLAVVEGALDRQVVHVGRRDGGHLASLDVGHPARRVQDHDLDGRPVAAGLDGRRAGVARGGPDDGDPLAPAGQLVVEEPTDQLQGDVLEGQGRPVEQLGHPRATAEGAQRHHLGMVEGGVGIDDHRGELVARRSMPSTNGHMTSTATSP